MTTQTALREAYDLLQEIIAGEPKPLAYTDDELSELVSKRLGMPVTENRIWYWRKDLNIGNCKARKRKYRDERQHQ